MTTEKTFVKMFILSPPKKNKEKYQISKNSLNTLLKKNRRR